MVELALTVAGLAPPPDHVVRAAVAAALAEDLGRRGDITSDSVIPLAARGAWTITAREAGRVAGLVCAAATFAALDPRLSLRVEAPDGADIAAGGVIARLEGPVRPALAGERTALNFLGHLSGIASLTARYAGLVAGTRASVCCTRKTTPGLRALEKYAVRAGGGRNHRFGLDDAVLIKDNHVAAAGGIAPAIRAARAHAGHMVRIEIEVDTLDQLAEALGAEGGPPDAVLLDNMAPATLAEAVAMAGGRVVLEASGGISEATIAEVAATGVDLVSVGALTHSARVLDIGLDAAG